MARIEEGKTIYVLPGGHRLGDDFDWCKPLLIRVIRDIRGLYCFFPVESNLSRCG